MLPLIHLYPCISYTRLVTFRYIWCSSVRNGLCGYLYDPKGILCIPYCIFVLRKFLLPLGTIWYVPVLISYFLVPLFTTWYLLGTYSVPTRYLLGTSRYPSVLIVTSWDNPFLNHPVDSGIQLRNLFNRYPSHRSRLLLKPQFWLTAIFWGKPGFFTPPIFGFPQPFAQLSSAHSSAQISYLDLT